MQQLIMIKNMKKDILVLCLLAVLADKNKEVGTILDEL